MTQEQADYMLELMEKNHAVCNGAGGYGRMMGQGAGYGMMGGGYGMMRGWNQ
jgi:hypothetical protein